jgi:hypothetical protein
MAKAIFRVPFTSDDGLYFNGYILPYDTGEMVTVNRENDLGEIVPTEVPLIKGGYAIIENVEPNENGMLQVELESSEAVINQLKADENYEFVRDVE